MRHLFVGVQASALIGYIDIKIDDGLIVTGVSSVGAVGTVKFGGWSIVNDSQTANWVVVNDSQVADWVEVDVAA